MALAAEQIQYLATLARLHLTEDEATRFAAQLEQILAYVAMLQQVETAEVPPTRHVLPMTNVFRQDVVAPSLPAEVAVANAPQRDGSFVKVPRVLEDA